MNITGFGRLYVTNFSPRTYESGNQIWDICKGSNGLLYAATGPLLEGGSDFWESHYLPGREYLRSVHQMDGNKILVGGNDEIGYFTRSGAPGETRYTSLMDRLDSAYHEFGSVWQILEHEGYYFLRAGKGIFKFDGDSIVPLVSGEIIDYICFLNNELFVLISGKGLGVLRADGFSLLPYGRFFADKKIVSITPTNVAGRFTIFTDDEGVFLADMDVIRENGPFMIPEIIESQISEVILLENQYYAVGTVKNGLYILDYAGEIIQHLNKNSGLQNNTIICMFEDDSHNLWLGLDYGISYVYLNSCLSIINSEPDIGTGYVSAYYKGKLYLGTNQGLYYLDWNDETRRDMGDMQIYPVKNSSGQVWDLAILEGNLYCSHHEGLFRIVGDRALLVSAYEGSWMIDSMYADPEYFLQSTYRGFYLYRSATGGWLEPVRKMEEMQNARRFSQDEEGNVWIVGTDNQLHMYTFDPGTMHVVHEKVFSGDDLDGSGLISVLGTHGQLVFSTDKGLFTYDLAEGKFVKSELYSGMLDTGEVLNEFFEDKYDRIWYVSQNHIGYLSLHFGQMEKISRPFQLVSNTYTHIFGKINVVDRDNILFGVDRGFCHYNAGCISEPAGNYRAYIIGLVTYVPPRYVSNRKHSEKHPVYPHKRNYFEFQLTSNMIESQEKVYYSYKLEGFDTGWSDWTTRNSKEFNNLMEGSYTFRVKAKDSSGTESAVASYSFDIDPPPTRTAVAYLIYLLLLVLILLLIRLYWKNRHKKEKALLETRKQQELEEKRKKYEEEQLKSRQRITELINEKLQQDLKHKSRELSNSMINILHKNEIMLNLKKEMQHLYLEKNLEKRDYNIKKLIRTIENEISTKRDLELFDVNFSAVHEEFLHNLKEKYPRLNQNDHRLCTFIKMNKSTKEIATFLNMSIRGVETSRYRLRKKMDLDSNENLYDVISAV